jgi:hypothetical protein
MILGIRDDSTLRLHLRLRPKNLGRAGADSTTSDAIPDSTTSDAIFGSLTHDGSAAGQLLRKRALAGTDRADATTVERFVDEATAARLSFESTAHDITLPLSLIDEEITHSTASASGTSAALRLTVCEPRTFGTAHAQ